LSKEYDVLSLAVSGVEKDNIKVSYFLQKTGLSDVEQIFTTHADIISVKIFII
jgi:hypothetical protein